MTYEIIMPVLGMSQDTGVIASWCKSVGDYVNAGEPIMEVETDKAVQEIEAAESGYLSKIFYSQDSEVPVGEVVGLLSEEMPVVLESGETASDETADVTADSAVLNNTLDEAPKASTTDTPSVKESRGMMDVSSQTVLASAKARAAAHKHQLSLADVSAALGIKPLHAADITTYLQLPASQAATSVGAMQALSSGVVHSATSVKTQMAFRVSRAGLKDCESWLAKQQSGDQELTSSQLIATLVSGLWREMIAEDEAASVTIDIECATQDGFRHSQLLNADLQRFSKLGAVTNSTAPADLQLIDLRYSTLCEYQPGAVAQPLLVIAKDRKQIKVSLYGISPQQNIPALRFMDSLAGQLEEPLVYLA